MARARCVKVPRKGLDECDNTRLATLLHMT
jgi:hypothetical protein